MPTRALTAPVAVAPGLRLVVAPNPSAMTGPGTNTWLVGQGRVAVIDPGPPMPSHLLAILAALGPGEVISHILVTHSHLDHSGLARALSDRCGAPVLAFGGEAAGRSARMDAFAARGMAPSEGVDRDFTPDRALPDGAEVSDRDGGWALTAMHTPGHFGNHLSFLWNGGAFSGDLAMGFSTSLVAAPDGDMAAYMASLARLSSALPDRLWPGHGAPVADALGRLDWLARHRREREAQVLAALARRPATAAELARAIYTVTPPHLLSAAALSVHSHLLDLLDRNRVNTAGFPGPDATFALA